MRTFPDGWMGVDKGNTPSYVDEQTSAYYSSRAEAIAAEYSEGPSPLESVKAYLPEYGTTLDIGCGSGRDLLWLYRRGLTVRGADSSAEMIAAATKLHPELSEKLAVTGLPDFQGLQAPSTLFSAMRYCSTFPMPDYLTLSSPCVVCLGRAVVSSSPFH